QGMCGLPAKVTASSSICPGDAPGSVQTAFDPPPGWDGKCTDWDAIVADLDCNGIPCVNSLSTDPLTIIEGGCTPSADNKPPVSPVWKTAALGCKGIPGGFCADP